MKDQNDREKIFKWREHITMLPENEFFGIIHVYLGEVKSPFNKQKLVEQLEALLRNADNQKTILALLDGFDAEVLSLVSLLPVPTEEKLFSFLGDSYTRSQIRREIDDLLARLIIFLDSKDQKDKILRLNPVLENLLQPKISLASILGQGQAEGEAGGDSGLAEDEPLVPAASLSGLPALLSAFVSYVMEHPDLSKVDGDFKKGDAARLEQIFPGKLSVLQSLLLALKNLLIIGDERRKSSVNLKRLEDLAALPEKSQGILLAVASVCPPGRNLLQAYSGILSECLEIITPEGLSRKNLIRAAFLATEIERAAGYAWSLGRFSRIVAEASDSQADGENSLQSLFGRIIDGAAAFGLLQKKSEAPATAAAASEKKGQAQKVITVSGLEITIVPGLSLAEYVKLAPFLSIKKYDTASTFELTKSSVYRAFGLGYDDKKILALLEQHSQFPLPQSLCASLADWHNSHNSAIVYKGYVLKLDAQKAAVFEKNRRAFSHVVQKIAEGIYLLDLDNYVDEGIFARHAGFDFLGSVSGKEKETAPLPFPTLRPSGRLAARNFSVPIFDRGNTDGGAEAASGQSPNSEATKITAELYRHLETLKLSEEKYSTLQSYIGRKIILSARQLETSYVHPGLLEARGMNFRGKIHILCNALDSGEKVTVTLPDEDGSGKTVSLTGTPIAVTKRTGEAELLLQLEKPGDTQKFLVSQLTKIRWHREL